jgi:hypothetical protein
MFKTKQAKQCHSQRSLSLGATVAETQLSSESDVAVESQAVTDADVTLLAEVPAHLRP